MQLSVKNQRRHGCSRSERGSALFLVPAGFFILLILGSIAVDSAIAFEARRELDSAVEAAANDAITLAIPTDGRPGGLQAGKNLRPDPERVTALVNERLGGSDIVVESEVNGDRLTVRATRNVRMLFANRHTMVRSQSTAQLSIR